MGIVAGMPSVSLIRIYSVESWGQKHQQRGFRRDNSKHICKCKKCFAQQIKVSNGAVAEEESGIERDFFSKQWDKKTISLNADGNDPRERRD